MFRYLFIILLIIKTSYAAKFDPETDTVQRIARGLVQYFIEYTHYSPQSSQRFVQEWNDIGMNNRFRSRETSNDQKTDIYLHNYVFIVKDHQCKIVNKKPKDFSTTFSEIANKNFWIETPAKDHTYENAECAMAAESNTTVICYRKATFQHAISYMPILLKSPDIGTFQVQKMLYDAGNVLSDDIFELPMGLYCENIIQKTSSPVRLPDSISLTTEVYRAEQDYDHFELQSISIDFDRYLGLGRQTIVDSPTESKTTIFDFNTGIIFSYSTGYDCSIFSMAKHDTSFRQFQSKQEAESYIFSLFQFNTTWYRMPQRQFNSQTVSHFVSKFDEIKIEQWHYTFPVVIDLLVLELVGGYAVPIKIIVSQPQKDGKNAEELITFSFYSTNSLNFFFNVADSKLFAPISHMKPWDFNSKTCDLKYDIINLKFELNDQQNLNSLIEDVYKLSNVVLAEIGDYIWYPKTVREFVSPYRFTNPSVSVQGNQLIVRVQLYDFIDIIKDTLYKISNSAPSSPISEVNDVKTASDCQQICLRNKLCSAVAYSAREKICTISTIYIQPADLTEKLGYDTYLRPILGISRQWSNVEYIEYLREQVSTPNVSLIIPCLGVCKTSRTGNQLVYNLVGLKVGEVKSPSKALNKHLYLNHFRPITFIDLKDYTAYSIKTNFKYTIEDCAETCIMGGFTNSTCSGFIFDTRTRQCKFDLVNIESQWEDSTVGKEGLPNYIKAAKRYYIDLFTKVHDQMRVSHSNPATASVTLDNCAKHCYILKENCVGFDYGEKNSTCSIIHDSHTMNNYNAEGTESDVVVTRYEKNYQALFYAKVSKANYDLSAYTVLDNLGVSECSKQCSMVYADVCRGFLVCSGIVNQNLGDCAIIKSHQSGGEGLGQGDRSCILYDAYELPTRQLPPKPIGVTKAGATALGIGMFVLGSFLVLLFFTVKSRL